MEAHETLGNESSPVVGFSMSSQSKKAITLYKQGKYKKAHAVYTEMLQHAKPQDRAAIWTNLGLCSSYFDVTRAEKEYKNAMQLGCPNAAWNYCILLLNERRASEAWNYWDARFFNDYATRTGFTKLPIQFYGTNEISTGLDQLLVLQEQGIGDEFLFLGSLLQTCRDHKRVIWQCTEPVQRLLQCVELPENLEIISGPRLSADLVYNSKGYTYAGCIFASNQKEPKPIETLQIKQGSINFTVWKEKLPPQFTAMQAFVNPLSPNASKRNLSCFESELPIVSLNHERMPYPEFVLQYDIKNFTDVVAICNLATNIVLAPSAVSQLCGLLGMKATVILPSDTHDEWRFQYPFLPSLEIRQKENNL